LRSSRFVDKGRSAQKNPYANIEDPPKEETARGRWISDDERREDMDELMAGRVTAGKTPLLGIP